MLLLYTITLPLLFAVTVTYNTPRRKFTNLRNRRVPMVVQAGFGSSSDRGVESKTNSPFVIRVPYSKIVPANALFSHSVSWKAKQTPAAAVKTADEPNTSAVATQSLPDVQISQFHSQDMNGQVVFGFNAPDQMRIEQRNADGTVHGTYSYLDPYGQIVKRQYWDTGAGFHVTSNNYPLNDVSIGDVNQQRTRTQYTPEVQAARDLHFQLYQQALASFLPSGNSVQSDTRRRNGSVTAEGVVDDSFSKHNDSVTIANVNASTNTNTNNANATSKSSTWLSERVDSQFQSTTNSSSLHANTATNTSHSFASDIAQPDTEKEKEKENENENGSIVIQKPEYLRISWTTENKRYRVDTAGASVAHSRNQNDDNWSIRHTIPTTTTTTGSNHSARLT